MNKEDFCGGCKRAFTNDDDEVLDAGGIFFHAQCFKCSVCKVDLENQTFYVEHEEPYCEEHFQSQFVKICGRCGENIESTLVSALNQSWHSDCFVCTDCETSLNNGKKFFKFKDKPYCKPCYDTNAKLEANKGSNQCSKCKQQLDGDIIEIDNERYHAHHFNCTTCEVVLDGNARSHMDKLYCQTHFDQVSNAICFACKQLIMGLQVTAMGKTFHQEHFVCCKCEKPFENMTFFESEGKAYCKYHYSEAMGQICGYCYDVIPGECILSLI